MGSTGEISNLPFQLFFGVAGMILLTVFLIVFFIVYQKRLLNEQEKVNKIEIEYQKSLLTAGILAQEEERKRYAVDLHDGVGGVLSAIKLYVQRLQLDMPSEEFSLMKERALNAITENILEIRTVTNNLLPQSLERVGLVAASKGLCNKLAEVKAIDVDFQANTEQRFDQNREKAVFRIIQELTNNTLKHSKATHVKLHFSFSETSLAVQFSENGQGFHMNPDRTHKASSGLGLKGIESRIAFLDAKWKYDTAPAEGVTVKFTLDLKTPQL
ncbi:sensor histidine kinase [Lewinella cohaerens]|uniref:sensor histidine kinase n=1 Tax=Lewinella cohaerens TaxID=70995 RepID=UPI00039EEA17|nr:ATP-binding protein [Lewinella cohaerens]